MPALTAAYASPTSPSHSFSSDLPALAAPPSTADRVAYLAALASALKSMQKDDEETYGEEVVDDD
ncbi:hypothetical protein J3E72DRAFT_372033 [Bipolaris maydis]|nr:hypothetical protein J3E74DRAFT_401842 [Bipolaris maydis]KAJ6200842.1 hypothetical protein J3E72DRAFT_372033 [Bipolaris maydis]